MRSPLYRFLQKIWIDDAGCWLWTASMDRHKYGQFRERPGRMVLAHRWGYEHLVGPIPNGLCLDHLCRITWCVNPEHLEPVTMKTNINRGLPPLVSGRFHADKTHCAKGHPFSEENTRVEWRKLESGRMGIHRQCRECSRKKSLAYWRRKHGKEASFRHGQDE